MMIDFTNELKEKMEREIRAIEKSERDPLRRYLQTTKMLEVLNGELKTFITGYEFKDEDEEIRFFKEIKPTFFSKLLFYLKLYNIETHKPAAGSDLLSAYYCRELDQISDYLHKRRDFYKYYRAGMTHRDATYFKRGVFNPNEQYLDGFYFERDPRFSSGCDFSVAKMMSLDMLQDYLRDAIERVNDDRPTMKGVRELGKRSIRWTHKKAGLIEVIYSLDSLGVFDNGELSLRRLQDFCEEHFDVNLGNIARALNEMRMRQNPTQFLDDMKSALLKRMKDTEERSLGQYRIP